MADFLYSIVLQLQDKLSPGLKRANQATKQIGKEAARTGSRFKDAFNSAKTSVISLRSGGLLGVASDLSIVSSHLSRVGRALSQFTQAVGDNALNFESSLSKTKAALSASEGNYQKLLGYQNQITEAAKDWSRANAHSIDDFSTASYQIISAGITDVEAVNTAARVGLKLSTATMVDATLSSKLLATAYNTMGDRSADASEEFMRMGDALAAGQAKFQFADLEALAEGLKYAASTSDGAAMGIEKLTFTIGALNSKGLQASLAGTALQNMFMEIRDASEELGFTIAKDVNGAIDLVKTFENLNSQWADLSEGLSDAQTMQLADAFGQRGGRAVIALASDMEWFKTQMEGMKDIPGMVNTMYTQMADTMEMKLAIISNRMNLLMLDFGKGANDVKLIAGTAASFLGELLFVKTGAVGEVAGRVAGATAQIGGAFFNAASGIMSTAASFASFLLIADKVPALQGIAGFLLSFASGFTKIGKAILFAIPKLVIWTYKVIAAGIAHVIAFFPIYAIIAAITLIIGLAALLIIYWKRIVAYLTKKVIKIFSAITQKIKELVKTNRFLRAYFSFLKQGFMLVTLPIRLLWEALKKVYEMIMWLVKTVANSPLVQFFFGASDDKTKATQGVNNTAENLSKNPQVVDFDANIVVTATNGASVEKISASANKEPFKLKPSDIGRY